MVKRILSALALMLVLVCALGSCGDKGGNGGTGGSGGGQPPAHTHNFGAWEVTSQASCESTGKEARYCTCGEEQTRTVESTGHTISEAVTKEATSYSTGEITKSCSKCSYKEISAYSLTEYTSEEIYEIASKSVGEVSTYNKSGEPLALGTAFVIGEDGTLVTNFHVIENAYSIKVKLKNTEYTVKGILAYDKDIDLAILKIDAAGLTALPTQTIGIKGGASVYAVGSSEGYTLSFSTGVIASPSRVFDGVSYIQHEAAISHGNSGGPLFNPYGEVIGINTLTNIDGQNLNFAISCAELDNLVYGTPLTMQEFYEKECDPFVLMMNYIIANGTYDYDDAEYELLLGYTYSSDYSTKYSRYANYHTDDGRISIDLFIDATHLASFYLTEELTGRYDWVYVDENDYYMTGTIIASTYDTNTLLGISNHNIYYSSLLTTTRKLASGMVSLICSYFTSDFSDIGVTASDIGFYCYD